MKKILLVTLSCILYVGSFAQSIELLQTDSLIIGAPKDNILKEEFLVKNTSMTDTARLKVYRTIISEVTGSENYFCFGPLCYPPFVDTSTQITSIPPNTVDSSFYADYKPNNNAGTTVIRYCFYDTSAIDSQTCFTVTYRAETTDGIDERATNAVQVLPNPAKDFINVQYNLKGSNNSFIIYDLIGNKVFSSSLMQKNGSMRVELSMLKKGIYFCRTISDGKVIDTDKLVITR